MEPGILVKHYQPLFFLVRCKLQLNKLSLVSNKRIFKLDVMCRKLHLHAHIRKLYYIQFTK